MDCLTDFFSQSLRILLSIVAFGKGGQGVASFRVVGVSQSPVADNQSSVHGKVDANMARDQG